MHLTAYPINPDISQTSEPTLSFISTGQSDPMHSLNFSHEDDERGQAMASAVTGERATIVNFDKRR